MSRISVIGRRAHGFTLLELLVVMAIVALLAAAMPAALNRALPGRRVAATVDQFVSAVRDVQTASVLSGQPVSIKLENHGFVISHGSKRSGAFHPSIRVRLTGADGRPAGEIVAFPDGSARGGQFEISNGSHRRVVVVSELTGRAFVEGA